MDSPFIDHPSHARSGIQPFPDRLHVLTMLENPLRWRARYRNYWMFQRQIETSGAILYTCEIASAGAISKSQSPTIRAICNCGPRPSYGEKKTR